MLTPWVTAVLAAAFPGIPGNAPPPPAPHCAPEYPGGGIQQRGIEVIAGGPEVGQGTLDAVQRAAGQSLRRLQGVFRITDPGPMRIVVHRSLDALPQGLRSDVPEGTPGFALLLRGEIHLMLREAGAVPPDDLRTVIAHEVVHLLVQQASTPHGSEVPRWFHEGLAQTLAGGTYYGAREDDIYLPLRADTLPPVIRWARAMPSSPSARRTAYAASHSFVDWLWARIGADGLRVLLAEVQGGEPWATAFVAAAGQPSAVLELEWREHVLRTGLARFLEANCFSLLLLGAAPLLLLAVYRRLRREAVVRARLAAEDAAVPPPPESDPPPSPGEPRP